MRFVIGPSNRLSAGVYVCNFQPGNLQAVAVKGLMADSWTLMKVTLSLKLQLLLLVGKGGGGGWRCGLVVFWLVVVVRGGFSGGGYNYYIR